MIQNYTLDAAKQNPMPSIDTIVYALWLIYLKKLSNEYVQQVHVFFIHLLFDVVVLLLKHNL